MNLLVDSDVIIQDVDGADVVIVKVPRADRYQRPVYVNNSMNIGTYRRSGEGDYRCTLEAVGAMMRDRADGATDKMPLDEIDLGALSASSIRGYRNEFATIRMNHPWTNLADEEFLLRLGAIGRSARDGKLHPTRAGLLMFGEAWRITDEFPNFFLDCRQVGEGRRWDNRIASDSGDWSGNVYDFWNRASVMLCEGLPSPFSLGPGLVRSDDTPQHEAVREGLTNALVHADYYGRTGVVAVKRRGVVKFSNPGCLRLPAEVVRGGGISDPRNKTLMTMFNLIGKGDKAGSGFDVFRQAAKYAGTAEPDLVELLEPDRVELTLYLEPSGAKLSALDGPAGVADSGNVVNAYDNGVALDVDGASDAKKDGVNVVKSDTGNGSIDEAIIQCIRKAPSASAVTIAEALGMSGRQVQRYLKRLREAGLIERVGGTRGHWEVKEQS